ncbi:hypothetical protein [Clostridium tyrobutyricum]|uniref:hypothetical protein n=1 Tax=Clostridium tyrobutyricum TaxID=1519 RepID=UPI001C38B59A|nr:hypothetical protein [Clostridium tyrobutyricum]MBV4422933.1 hypothetical protein [Clostridium tyrobutyricum]
MENVIYYYKYALELCKQEERVCNITGKLDEKLSRKIKKIFQWDLELNLIC